MKLLSIFSQFFYFGQRVDSPVLPDICEILDFRQPQEFPVTTKGKALHQRDLSTQLPDTTGHRRLQFEGERCDVNVLDTAKENPDLTTFVTLVEAADLQDVFLCAGPFTILAPTNNAFAELDPDLVEDLLRPQNQELLQEVLLYHILPGFQPSNSFQAGPTDTLLYGYVVEVDLNPLMFNNANVIEADIEACNGIIHTIDDVMSPNDKDICDAFEFGNRRRLQDGGEDCDSNVLETARGYPELSVVVSLIETAGLEDIFTCAGPFTALLPNNAAFDSLDPGLTDFLLNPDNLDYLQNLLLYHFLPGATMTTEFQDGPFETLYLDFLVDVTLRPIRFDNAAVLSPDIVTCNGLLNILDTVLNPFPQTAPPTFSPTPAPTTATPTVEPSPKPTVFVADICEEYDFSVRRGRTLQDGGRNCETNILETAREFPDLTLAVTLFDLAGLTDIFTCPGPFTALIPTNSAFDEIDPTYLAFLTDPENIEELKEVLLYHILPGATLEEEFVAGSTQTLLTGEEVDVTIDPLQFDFVNAVDTNIKACNGYIHVIDGVLNPFLTRKSA